MEINLIEMFELQKKLDTNIELKHNLNKSDLFQKRKLALIVEINEMINVSKCFKFWSSKKEYDRNKLGDEFVDCLHFILSLSLSYGVNKTNFYVDDFFMDDEQLTNYILELIELCLKIDSSKDCEKVIEKLLGIAYTFNFSENDIIYFYKKKNEINFCRQENNY